jgi:heme exporter protein C
MEVIIMKIHHWWWKILGVILVIYTIIVGLATPLKPGIISVDRQRFNTGESVEITIYGYNQNFDIANDHTAYIKVDDEAFVESSSYKVIDYNQIAFTFNIPDRLPTNDSIVIASITVDNEVDGYSLLPNSLFIYQQNLNNPVNQDAFVERPEVHHLDSFRFPYRSILNETIRNTFFHVTLWFSMFILLIAGLYYAIKYLVTKELDYDHRSRSLTVVAILFGVLGLITGSIWARFTWGAWWTTDVKLNMSAVAMLIYAAYLVLRSSIKDQDQEARLASAYNIFAFVALIPLVFIIPRLTDSLHPGNGGNPALGGEDLDNTLRIVFYPSIIGMTLIGLWIATLYYRYIVVKEKILLK